MTVNLIFCHLGSQPPKHLIENLVLTRSRFPLLPIHLITSKETENKLDNFSSDEIYTHVYNPSGHVTDILSKQTADISFRQGFWRYTIERLIAVCEYINEKNLQSALSVESDMLLLPNFPMEDLVNIKNLAWGLYNENRDVGSLVFVPNPKKSTWLLNTLLAELNLNSDHTDMTILRKISDTNRSEIRYFPVPIMEMFNVNSSAPNSFIIDLKSRLLSLNGVFDSAALGMWLTGQDPRNNYGSYKLFSQSNVKNGDSLLDPSKLELFIERGSLYAKFGIEKMEIHCLHIHSKNIEIFAPNLRLIERNISLFKKTGKSILKMKWSIFLSLFFQALQEKKVISFIAFMPGMNRVSKPLLVLTRVLLYKKRARRGM